MNRSVAIVGCGGIGLAVGLLAGPVAGFVGALTIVLAIVLGGVGAAVATFVTASDGSDEETVTGSSEPMTELQE
ncbi:hypothetical protein [Halorarius litoreus]|uniref:hypothetical protein n=1 Tax=Halorarius litoreus TaxID=2962676 RepID=UPI0020CC8129|nr:hypothetical protein [Halorarius litoreus]